MNSRGDGSHSITVTGTVYRTVMKFGTGIIKKFYYARVLSVHIGPVTCIIYVEALSAIYRTVFFFRIYCQIWVNLDTTDMHIMQGCTNTGRQHFVPCGRDSSLGNATRYGLDGPGIEFRWEGHFLHLSRPALGPNQPPIQRVPVLSRG